MNARQLYARTPEYVIRKNLWLYPHYFEHLPEVPYHAAGAAAENVMVEARVLANHEIDHRRAWILATMWFRDRPFMVIQNAGRDSGDHRARFVTDVASYRDAVGYLTALITPDQFGDELIDEHVDLPQLTAFYGHTLDDVAAV